MAEAFNLNPEQLAATDAVMDWLSTSSAPFFLLSGSAGTGKTYSLQALIPQIKGRIIFTAPTNKAVRVLRKMLTSEDYKPECRTIYSLLGLRLEANGEVKELAEPEDPVDLTQYRLVVVDEGSMVNRQVFGFIKRVAQDFNVKFLFMGDAAQLPPVKEDKSLIWTIPGAELRTVMRYDNQILKLATSLRDKLSHPAPIFKPASDNDGQVGIWTVTGPQFQAQLADKARNGHFQVPDKVKALAWRNVTVDSLNTFIRSHIFDAEALSSPWLPTDRVTLTGPAADLEGEPMGHTDDEGSVVRVDVDFHPLYPEYKVHRISMETDDGRFMTLQVLHPDDHLRFQQHKARLAAEAKIERRRWRNFWDLVEAFHQVRHAYAGTVHRAQGSTYENVFVDWRDILLNRNRTEAIQCLYVAVTRASQRVIFN